MSITAAQKERLKGRDFVLLIDQSGSMGEKDQAGGVSRWKSAQETTEQIARVASELDPDGITVVTFNNTFRTHKNVTPDKVKEIFEKEEPNYGTKLQAPLASIFADFKSRMAKGDVKPNGEMLVVVTDGEPQDKNEVAKEIINFGNALPDANDTYGILFLQIGNDAGATAFLKKLDDDLTSQGAKNDIVDTKTMDELGSMSLGDAFIAALDD